MFVFVFVFVFVLEEVTFAIVGGHCCCRKRNTDIAPPLIFVMWFYSANVMHSEKNHLPLSSGSLSAI